MTANVQTQTRAETRAAQARTVSDWMEQPDGWDVADRIYSAALAQASPSLASLLDNALVAAGIIPDSPLLLDGADRVTVTATVKPRRLTSLLMSDPWVYRWYIVAAGRLLEPVVVVHQWRGDIRVSVQHPLHRHPRQAAARRLARVIASAVRSAVETAEATARAEHDAIPDRVWSSLMASPALYDETGREVSPQAALWA